MEPAGCVPPGGVPWQELQVMAPALQLIAFEPAPFVKLPWQ